MKTLATVSITLFAAGLVACGGTITDPNTTVATLSLTADAQGSLIADACVTTVGQQSCMPYPNDSECDRMNVDVLADGRTVVRCYKAGALLESGEATVVEGAPFICKARTDLSCQVCNDVYGTPVLDTCNRGTKLYRRSVGGWGAAPGDDVPGVSVGGNGGGSGGPDTLPPGTGDNGGGDNGGGDTGGGDNGGSATPPTTPGGGSTDVCDPDNAKQNYADAINKILADEGLGFEWKAEWLETINVKKGFWGYQGYGKQNLCNKKWKSKLTKCWNKSPNKCHCKGSAGSKQTCRCVRINVFALKAACAMIPPQCQNKSDHAANLVISYGAATAWLFSTTYAGKAGAFGATNVPTLPPSVIPPKCLGSPLVLDLDGDGIAPTSDDKGVSFDLLGHGAQQTAWIEGDDALLVYDRNGNGTIDDGTELFGSATPVDGLPAADGFEALAELDKVENGGNGNGIVEAGDLLFAELSLWRDENGDGVSQPGELSTLSAAKVKGVVVKMTEEIEASDAHGNDLGMRGAFIRDDGKRGLMVDVLFSTSRRD